MRCKIQLLCSACLYFFSVTIIAAEYRIPPFGNDIIGQNYIVTVHSGDSLNTIRERNDVSYDELLVANPNVNFYHLRVGQQIVIPKQFILPKFRRGIVINVAELRLYYFTPDGRYVYTYPAGLGRIEWRTPLASATVVRKEIDPTWHVPNDIRNYVYNKTGEILPDEVPPGPKNPLGNYALYLSKSGYLIHGTNAPHTVGTFISSGCIRLLREPIELLYQEAQVGTPVHIIHHPNKAGWRGNILYLESHPVVGSYAQKPSSSLNEIDARAAIYYAINLRPAYIDWNAVKNVVRNHTGIPYPIGKEF